MQLLSRFLNYFGEVKAELAKVTWPTQNQTMALTWLVIGVSLVVALYLGLLDALFQRLVEWLIGLKN
ncbi:MAG TPA: preprotein translocase subunit SecE [Candidatus Pacebacteria bacterium]|nr:preprotein translocase subunit SecE [Candidatus Paceibacterota bacterium]